MTINKTSGILIRVMLMSALKALVKNLFQESFNITFMRNEKSCQNINFFSHFNKIINEYLNYFL